MYINVNFLASPVKKHIKLILTFLIGHMLGKMGSRIGYW